MRLIKFRGKHLDNGEWVYGSYVECWQHTYEGDAHPVHQICDKDGDTFNIHPETVGQFTGLLDKNGMEIYEGDIIQHGYVSYQYLIEYIGSGFQCCKRQGEVCFSLFEAHLHEVIGNLHDNPELLKTE